MLSQLAVVLALIAQPQDLLLHLPLDGSVQPTVGGGVPEVEGTAQFQPGRVGQALVVGDGAAQLVLKREGNVQTDAGSVALWVKPLDWSGNDDKFHVFFEAKDPGWLLVYKYLDPDTGLLLLMSDNVAEHGWQVIRRPIKDWKPGEWHHVVATWDRTAAMLYVDGVAATPLIRPPVPSIATDVFYIGDRPWHVERKALSLIDEIYIFERPIEAQEVAALHTAGAAGKTPAFPLAELVPLRVELRPEAWRQRWVVSANMAGLASEDRRAAKIEARLFRPDGSEAWVGNLQAVTGHLAGAELPLELKPAGLWKLEAWVSVGQRVLGRAEATAEMPDTSWIGNDLYEEVRLLPPWTPLGAEESAVRMWGRRYQLSPVGLTELENQGTRLLSGPCRLEAQINGKPVTAVDLSVRLGRHTDAWAEFEGRGRLSSVRLASRLRAEFDGLLTVDLTLEPEAVCSLEALRWVLPLRAGAATLMHYPGLTWREAKGGMIPQGEDLVWKSDKFMPFLWAGDEDRGVMWFGESDQGWRIAKDKPCLYLRRQGDSVEMVIEPVSERRDLGSAWTWSFGLMATPVKPLPPDWRKWRLEPGRGANVSIVWPSPSLIKYFGYPWPTTPEDYRKMVESKHAQGIKVVPYSCLTFLSEASPEWSAFSEEWAVPGVADRTSSDVGAYNVGFMGVCPGAEGWADFAVWANKRYMNTFELDGLYHDNTFPYACNNELHGHGWQEEGQRNRRSVYPILAHRRLYRRIYAMMKDLGRETYMMAHMSGRVNMPVLSFTDAYLDGEHFRSWVDDDYRKVLPLDQFRAEFMGRQWGIMPVFLPELGEKARQTREATRQMLSMTLLHDTPVWAIWCSTPAVDEVRRALDEFGYVQADFAPYWQEPVRSDDPDVRVSAYLRDEKALLVVSNFAYEAKTVTLEADRAKLKLGADPLVAMDAESGQSVAAAGAPVKLTVPAGDLRLILLTTGP